MAATRADTAIRFGTSLVPLLERLDQTRELACVADEDELDGFQVPDERLNPNGGAVAIGHPVGSSGIRYLLTLATELRQRQARYGVLGVDVGSGQGIALALENPEAW
jgi:acetyl-CoA acetyltransferase